MFSNSFFASSKKYPFFNETAIIKKFAENNKVMFIDSINILNNQEEETLWVSTNDTHANKKTHTLIGKFLYEKLRYKLKEI